MHYTFQMLDKAYRHGQLFIKYDSTVPGCCGRSGFGIAKLDCVAPLGVAETQVVLSWPGSARGDALSSKLKCHPGRL